MAEKIAKPWKIAVKSRKNAVKICGNWRLLTAIYLNFLLRLRQFFSILWFAEFCGFWQTFRKISMLNGNLSFLNLNWNSQLLNYLMNYLHCKVFIPSQANNSYLWAANPSGLLPVWGLGQVAIAHLTAIIPTGPWKSLFLGLKLAWCPWWRYPNH